jgi:acyl-CoA thioesterase-1
VNLRSVKLTGSECARALLFFLVCGVVVCACGQSDAIRKGDTGTNMGGGGVEEAGRAKGRVVYAALGDSTGVGVGAREGGGYVARLFERIRPERPDSKLINLCVSGATTEDVLRGQLREAINARPTLVTLGIGINDLGHGLTAEQFARNYEEIVRQLKTETSARVVVTNVPDISLAPVVPASEREATRRRIELFNEKLEAIARRYELSVVDIYAETHRVIPEHPEFFSDDGFHPSAAGYSYWAETMWPAVKEAIGD